VWPDGNLAPQSFTNVAPDQAIEIRQFSQQYTKIKRQPYSLGGAQRETSSHPPNTRPVASR
jgi:hypothetical protein